MTYGHLLCDAPTPRLCLMDPTLTQVVAGNVKRLREKWGWSQDRLAREFREHGLRWTASSVAALETNRRGISLEEFVLLKWALHTDYENLLRNNAPFIRVESAEIRGEEVEGLFVEYEDSEPDIITDASVTRALDDVTRALGEASDLAADLILKGVGLRLTKRNRALLLDAIESQPERQLAKSLGMEVVDVAALALKLWGRSLSDERDARLEAGHGEPPQGRSPTSVATSLGHITRQQKRELIDAAKKAGIRRRKGA